MEDLLLRNLLFQISYDFVTFETNFKDGFLNHSYVGLKEVNYNTLVTSKICFL